MTHSQDNAVAERIMGYLETHKNYQTMTKRDVALEAVHLTLDAIRQGWEQL